MTEPLLAPDSALLNESGLLDTEQAAQWATKYTGKAVTTSNISYLVKYGRLNSVTASSNKKLIDKRNLEKYFAFYNRERRQKYEQKFGPDLNWDLSFDQYKERETTKHVHRLHPYKGKFIPQLVEYFLDAHTDGYKKDMLFKPGDTILDPFSGSGTTLIQANELGLHAIGVDVSVFNAHIANAKCDKYDLRKLQEAVSDITQALEKNPKFSPARSFERELRVQLKSFNDEHFPSPKFRQIVRAKPLDEAPYRGNTELVAAPLFPHCLTQ